MAQSIPNAYLAKISDLLHVYLIFLALIIIYLWIHMKFLMKRMSCSWNIFLMEFNLFMQVNFVKELEAGFGDFVDKLLEEMLLWNPFYITYIYIPIHYIMFNLMVQ